MSTRQRRWTAGWLTVACIGVGLVASSRVELTAAQARGRRVCTPSAQVICGSLIVGPGIASPRLADNGADIGVIWTAGTPANHTIQFARIDERARVIETFIPIARTAGDVAIAGANGGFLVAYRSDNGTTVVRIDRDGQPFGEPHRVAAASDTLDLVHLDAAEGGPGLTALVLGTGVVVRVVYFDANGMEVQAPPRGVVLYGVGARTRVFIVPFTSHAVNADDRRYSSHTEAQSGDTVVATVSSTAASYEILRLGQRFAGSSNRTGQLDLNTGSGGLDLLAMHTADGSYHDSFTPATGPAIEHDGVVGGRRPGGRGLAGEANLRDRSYLPTTPYSGVEIGLLGDFDGAATLVIARIRVRPPRVPAGRARP